ncbi:MAG: hypothetical protein QOK35_2505 [Pseudonocardiales bacterium]|nr:hypothetical protein [Pseudonocardiales bacterium]
MRVPKAVRGPLLALLGLTLGVAPGGDVTAPSSGVDTAHLPATARTFLPLITDLTAQQCPELPPLWVVGQVAAESGWDPTAEGGGVAGLLQFDELTWVAAGGAPWPSPVPRAGDPILDPETHLRVAVPWLCSTLRAVEGHLAATGKSAEPLDAMLVCHVAGCGRVTGSASGVPQAGEAGCDARCAALVAHYLDAVHAHVREYATAAPAPPVAPSGGSDTQPAPPAPDEPEPPRKPPAPLDPATWTGGATGCTLPDPTGGRCVTGATRHGFEAAATAFDGWHAGPAIRSAGCWDRHAWNPRSDHPHGRACDLFATKAGRFADGSELAEGWRVADWFRGHAGPLQVKYVIWQGRYWAPQVRDQDGWGRRYSGGGVYDVRDATGGHYDHVHVSFRE